ncbi:hypothetical protein BCR42DRAFT_446262 [Absidia repens]|uniref:Formin GTPase-binding domain-containing protein n=1 Tax=Absidia repens TaxID=90262 RepID=A0A1X2IYA6_9FUNG|nr:hypothetical protein BCR42DRAFT_446262 [Absidia repens]
MLQNSSRNMPYEASPSPSSSNQPQQQQPRLLNRMSEFLFQKRQGPLLHEEYSEPSHSAHSGIVTSSIGGGDGTSANYSAMDEDNGSRVDSMFSSIQSNQSSTWVNPNTPPPLRTVRLDGGIIHRPGGGPPSPPQRRAPSQSTANDHTSTTPTTATMSNSKATTAATATSPSTANTSDNVVSPSDEGFDQAFEKMANEYGLPDNVAKTLSLDAKRVLLQNSQANSQQQTNASNGFFLWRTWGIQKKQKHHMDVRHDQLFNPSTSSTQSSSSTTTATAAVAAITGNSALEKRSNKRGHNGNSINNTRKKAYSTSARGRSQHTSIIGFGQDHDTGKKSTQRYHRSLKKVLSPEYFIHLLKDCHVRELDESQVQDLRVCLRSVKASWTTQFLQLDGYNVLSDLFRQMNQAPKRSPNDDKILQHLAKCFKAIMTHEQAGITIVLTNPVGLEHIRDLLFGQVDQKQRALYSLSVITRAHLLNILCTLANLQTTQTDTVPYIHGYDVLRRLLLDRSSTTQPTMPLEDDDRSPTYPTHDDNHRSTGLPPSTPDDTNSSSSTAFPFRMTLKEDPQTIMKIILENDPFYTSGQPLKPRYTAWMRELQYTVEKEIEPITFLAQVLDYKFESAFRQLRITPPTHQQDATIAAKQPELDTINGEKDAQEEGTGSVMVDDGVVEYLIAHLRLINTVVSTQPTFHTAPYDDYGREKVRTEVMMSGFDKISKALQCCPHPTLYAFYFRYLQPLLQPLADITPKSNQQRHLSNPDAHESPEPQHRISSSVTTASCPPSNDDMVRWEDEVRQAGGSGIFFEQPPWEDDSFYDDDDSDAYEDYDSDDEDQMEAFNYNDSYEEGDDNDSLAISSVQDRWR